MKLLYFMPTPFLAVTVPPMLLHKANPAFREDIRTQGLLPQIGPSYECHYEDEEEMKPHFVPCVFACLTCEYDSTWDDDVWVIDTRTAEAVWESDPAMWPAFPAYVRTRQPVPAAALLLAHAGTGTDRG